MPPSGAPSATSSSATTASATPKIRSCAAARSSRTQPEFTGSWKAAFPYASRLPSGDQLRLQWPSKCWG